MPSWDRRQSESELEYQRSLKERGRLEEQQLFDNLMQGDYLGLEDGRPGISVGPAGRLYMPFAWRILIWIGGLALLAVLAFGTRACIGEERAQEYRQGEAAGQP